MAPLIESDGAAECIADVRALLGEGPVWVAEEQALYWLDIKGRRLFRRDSQGALTEWQTPMRVGSIAPRRGGGFIAGTEDGFAEVDLGEGRFAVFHDPEPHLPNNRFNDGKVDHAGRFWAGTMDDLEEQATGSLYRLEADRRCTLVDDGYKVTNGPAFSPDGRIAYHTDSAFQRIYAFDMGADGELANRRIFARFGEGEGFPDGMTVDSDGCLWVAFWDGWCLRKIAPDGKVAEQFALPVQRPTSCTFGGADLDELYVTSARIGLDNDSLKMQPCAGGLFLLQTGSRGVRQEPFAG